MPNHGAPGELWPPLAYESWADTRETLHRFSQIVGKTRLALEPMVNHWWQVPLYVSARGLTTSAMPYGAGAMAEVVEVEMDFLSHQVEIRTSEGGRRSLALGPRSVADFYADYRGALQALGVEAEIWPVPVELPDDALPFADDRVHASYDPAAAERFWRVLLQADRIFKLFRSGFIGKASPVHFFWGSFDLAVTRFSGRPAPPHPGGAPHVADRVMREAYSHEVSSAGFWPGSAQAPAAAFYSYAYPAPAGYAAAPVAPAGASYEAAMGEFILPYETLRAAADPERALMAFLQSTYEAAANLASWDRAALERPPTPGTP
jgi:Family of unknown function (DUF5996)